MIIGIDPGLSVTAVVWDNKYDFIKTKGEKKDRASRLNYLNEGLNKIFQSITYKTINEKIFVFLEEISFGSFSRSISVMGEVNGVIKLNVFLNFGLESQMVSPTQWKKIVLGKGNLNKEDIRKKMKMLYGKEFENQHLYDAWCIRKYGEILLKNV